MSVPMRTVLICHEESVLHSDGLARWLASFSTLAGIVVLQEPSSRTRQRIKREFKRAGALGFADVLAFRAYYKAFVAARDHRWGTELVNKLQNRFPVDVRDVPLYVSTSVNSEEVEKFVRECRPDMMFALCKTIIKKKIFGIPSFGTYVFHPGVCPEYRNAHGCFWALANRDLDRVGMTLLRIDEGVDTGPIYGYFSYPYDEVNESHYVIQNRVVFDNLDALKTKLFEIRDGTAEIVQIAGRKSGVWGQPRLSAWLSWKRAARHAHSRRVNQSRVSS
ncbi:MAG: formyltransferase family protein [Gemmatimonadaceae bacterium]